MTIDTAESSKQLLSDYQCDKVLLPLFLAVCHQSLVVLDTRDQSGTTMDASDTLPNQGHSNQMANIAVSFIEQYLPNTPKHPHTAKAVLCRDKNNGVSCGVLVLAFAIYILASRPLLKYLDVALWRCVMATLLDVALNDWTIVNLSIQQKFVPFSIPG
ncbi:ulp1 protease family protein [Colletotrichum asianum]